MNHRLGSQARSGPPSNDVLVVGRVPVFWKEVAPEKVQGRQRAEQIAASWRASGLKVEIEEARAGAYSTFDR